MDAIFSDEILSFILLYENDCVLIPLHVDGFVQD